MQGVPRAAIATTMGARDDRSVRERRAPAASISASRISSTTTPLKMRRYQAFSVGVNPSHQRK
jgi:hypothetical protein